MGQPSLASKIKTWLIYTLAEIAVKCLGVLPLYAADPEAFYHFMTEYIIEPIEQDAKPDA